MLKLGFIINLLVALSSVAQGASLDKRIANHLRGYVSLACSASVDNFELIAQDGGSFNVKAHLDDKSSADLTVEVLPAADDKAPSLLITDADLPASCTAVESLSLSCGDHWYGINVAFETRGNVIDLFFNGDSNPSPRRLRTRIAYTDERQIQVKIPSGVMQISQPFGEWVIKMRRDGSITTRKLNCHAR